MKSKVITVFEEKLRPKYPYIGQAENNQTILFTAPKTGTLLVKGGATFDIGLHYDNWNEDAFAPVDGITIQFN